jgi:hypothetical protein
MNDKFQQVYDYLSSVGSLAEGSTAESFNEKYTSGSGNINRLYSQVASDPDFPIEFSSIEQFQTDVFGGLKKKAETEQSPLGPPSEEAFMESTSSTPQDQPSESGDSDWQTVDSGVFGVKQQKGDSTRYQRTRFTASGKGFMVPVNYYDYGENFLKGDFGSAVNNVPIIGQFVDNMARASASGYAATDSYKNTRWAFNNPSEESVEAYTQSINKYESDLNEYGKSEEMKALESDMAKYKEEDGDWFGSFKALALNPQAVMEYMVNSMAAMPEAGVIKEGMEVVATAAAAGLGVGLAGGVAAPITVPVAVGGAIARSIPFAMARMGREIEVINSQTEFLKEELEKSGLEFNPEDILTVLTDENKYKSIRNRSIARGDAISYVDAFFGSVLSGVFRSLKVADKISDVGVVTGQASADVVSGMGGESLARLSADQEMSAQEILTEGLSSGPTTATNLATTYIGMKAEKARTPKTLTPGTGYYLNNERVDKEDFSDFIETATPEQIQAVPLSVKNDPDMSQRVEEVMERNAVEANIDPDITGETREQLIELETRLMRLDGKTGRSSERARQQYQEEIDALVEGYKPEEAKPIDVDESSPISEAAQISQSELDAQPISEQELANQEKERREKQRELRQKAREEDIYRGEKRTVKGFVADVLTGRTGLQRKWLSARKFMPRSMYKAYEAREARMASQYNNLTKTINKFEAMEQSIPEADRESFNSDFNTYLSGGERGSLSNEAVTMANEMRAEIDNLSIDLINSGVVKASSVDAVVSNLGSYMNTAYRNFEGKEWRTQLKTEEGQVIVNKAHNFIKQSRPDLVKLARETHKDPEANPQGLSEPDFLDYLVEGEINAYLSDEDRAYIKGSGLGTEKEGILKQKKELPVEIRALLGEYSDPVQNYVKTIHKMTALSEARKFNNTVSEAGKGVYLFDSPRGEFSEQVTLGENTFYTTKEIANEVYPEKNTRSSSTELALKFVGGVKWAKTIGSVGTHGKNVVGNFGFMIANGHAHPWNLKGTARDASKAFDLVYNDMKALSNKEKQAKLNYYIELGVVKQSVGIGELSYLFNEDKFQDAASARLDSSTKKKLKGAKKGLENAYQAEDDFFKIMAFESEQRRYSNAMFGVDPAQLTDQQRTQLDSEVAEIVKNTFPTYSRTPEIINRIKGMPVMGNFVSFQAESYRTSWNILAQANKEMKSDNPSVRAIGRSRLAGVSEYQGIKTALVGGSTLAIGMGAQGVMGALASSDEEKQRDEDIRKFVPFWSEESKLYMSEFSGDGKFSYVDFSASDPFGGIDKVVGALSRGETITEGFGNAMVEFIAPFTGMDIATRRALNLSENRDDYGKKIYFDDDTETEKMEKATLYMMSVFEPGTVTSMKKIYGSDTPANELIGQFTGYKEVDVEVEKSLSYKLRDHAESIKEDAGVRYSDLEKGSPLFKLESWEKANDMLRRREQLIFDDVQSAIRLGVPVDNIVETMKERMGISEDRIFSIMSGPDSFIPLKEQNPKYE